MKQFLVVSVIVWMTSAVLALADSGLHTCFSNATGRSRIFLIEKSDSGFVVKAQVEERFFSICSEQDTIRLEEGIACVYGKRGGEQQIATFYPKQLDRIVDFMVNEGVDVRDQSTWQYKTTTPCVKN